MGSNDIPTYRKIGLLGGMGAASTADYYRGIIELHEKNFDNLSYPEIAIESVNFQRQIDAGYQDFESFKNAVDCLKLSGCEFFLPACNSIHVLKSKWCNDSIPWLDIVRPVAGEIKRQGVRTVLILGTSFTINNKIYDEEVIKAGAVPIYPTRTEIKRIDNFIYSELIYKKTTTECDQFFNDIALKHNKKNTATGVILGCTEFQYIDFSKTTQMTGIKFFDSTAIHIRAGYEFSRK